MAAHSPAREMSEQDRPDPLAESGDDGSGEPGEAVTRRTPSLIAGRYRVEGSIGRGAAGEIFEVTDTASGERFALKWLRREAAADRTHVMRFEREYHTLRGLSHPRIIRVHDYGNDGAPYYTMELVDGSDLRDLGPLPYREACRYLRDIASSLALLHTRGLLHRDVSPRNARVGRDGCCKLLDFGALSPFGTARQLVGTPPCVPPEALRRMPLDQRVDLYALGAVAYCALTGRHAYPSRRFSHLETAWKIAPPPPSSLARGIPAALDELVLELLSLDPLERPGSAAAVIDRLTAIADLPRENDTTVAAAYLTRPSLVGRSRELEVLRSSVAKAIEGESSALFVEGGPGLGKSRLLAELEVDARQRGAIAARIDAEIHRDAFGSAVELALAVLDQCPEAEALAGPLAPTLAQLSPRLSQRLRVEPEATDAPAGERRAVLQEAVTSWLASVAERSPLALVVDNAHRADAASLAALLGLVQRAPRCRTLVALGLTTTDEAAAAELLERYRARSAVLELLPLSVDETHQLTESLFGRVAFAHRFATWLEQSTGGNPLYCIELVRSLVAQGVIRYEEGSWLLPKSAPDIVAARSVTEIFRFALAALSKDALRLARILSVHRGAIPLDLCVAAAGEGRQGHSYELLNELVEARVLTGDGDEYHFKHGALREALAEQLAPEDRRAVHRLLGRTLLQLRGGDRAAAVEAGWHLLHGGARVEGAELLASVADKTRKLKAIDTDLQAAVPALAAALQVFEEEGRSLSVQIPLLSALVEAGYYSDRRLAERYGDRALAATRAALGLDIAERLRPLLGGRASLAAGLALGAAKLRLSREAPREGQFKELLVELLGTVTYLTGIATICLDADSAERYAAMLEPFTVLGEHLAPAGVHDYCRRLAVMARDDLHDSREGWASTLRRLDDRTCYRGLPRETRQLFKGGAWYAFGALESFRDNGAALDCADKLDELGLRFYQIVADRLRVAHHAYRGEEARAVEYRERLELQAAQIGSAWQVEAWDAAASMTSYSLVGDRLGLRRCAERLEALGTEIPSMKIHALCARGLYARYQGDPGRCVELYRQAYEATRPRAHIGWSAAQGQLAAAQNDLGDHEAARAICLSALSHASDEDLDFALMMIDLQAELAIARGHLGDTARARRDLDALLARYHDRGPLTRALAHRARARVCALGGDHEAARESLDAMERLARSTGNAALINRWKRTAATLESLGVRLDRFESFEPAAMSLAELRVALPRPPIVEDADEDDYTVTESHVD